VPKSKPEVKRGDIFMVDWGGHAGTHPALVIQNDIGNKHSSNTIVAYITHTTKQLPMLVNFKDHESSLKTGGSVDLGRIMTIPKSYLGDKVGHLSSTRIPDVDRAIVDSLGVDIKQISPTGL
jgi:mRNA interferase MazF